MAYFDFSIESAVAPSVSEPTCKLDGMGTVIRTIKSKSKSTEEFIQGAVSSLANADRQVMYVHSTLEALNDRLDTAMKVAKAVNPAKARGVEGFQNIPMLDPWAFAIEGKAKDFFVKIWRSICTACNRVIEAIVYIVRWIGNAVASASVKGQVKDYKFYVANKARIEKYAKEASVDKNTFNAPDYKVSGDGLAKLIEKTAGLYIKGHNGDSDDEKVIEKAAATEIGSLHDAQDFQKAFNSIFGLKESVSVGASNALNGNSGTAQGAFNHVTNHVKEMINKINKSLESDISAIFNEKGSMSPSVLVTKACTKNEGKVIKMSVGNMKKLSNDFKVLDEGWLEHNVKAYISSISKQEKAFTKYTKTIRKLADRFEKTLGDDVAGVKSLSRLTSELANARIRYNSFWSNLMLYFETMALRFRKSSHIALKFYIKAVKKGHVATEESMEPESVEALFNFD